MVKLQEVEDEHFTQDQPAPTSTTSLPKDVLLADDDDDMAYSDTDSSITASSASDDDDDEDDDGKRSPHDESLIDRLIALRDIIPPQRRAALSSSFQTSRDIFRTGLRWGGKTLWVVSTSVMLIGMPFALAYVDEAQQMEQEKEMRMQQSANEIVAPGAASLLAPPSGGPGAGQGERR
ncbi:MAG: mRNA turnover and ribosome assembly protein [Watsoniomyces obsoletus]|nr:MAG: mRNA turnover and ribosome assembly protein [Watsoniomyces obsoletus]